MVRWMCYIVGAALFARIGWLYLRAPTPRRRAHNPLTIPAEWVPGFPTERVSVKSVPYDFGRPLSDRECPSCGHAFSTAPTRQRKCPRCHQFLGRIHRHEGGVALLNEVEFSKYQKAIERAFSEQMRVRNRQIFNYNRERALSVGSVSYIWRRLADDECENCRVSSDREFRWDQGLPLGHAGTCIQCPEGYCRCYAEAVIP